MTRLPASRRRPGYVLIAVLIVIVVLSLAAYRFLDAMASEAAVAQRTTEFAQARTYADQGARGLRQGRGVAQGPEEEDLRRRARGPERHRVRRLGRGRRRGTEEGARAGEAGHGPRGPARRGEDRGP